MFQRQQENKIKTTECYTHSSLKANLPIIHSKKNLKPPAASGFNKSSASSCPLCQFFLPKTTKLKSETALHWCHHTLEKTQNLPDGEIKPEISVVRARLYT